jgi:hypothetical protein
MGREEAGEATEADRALARVLTPIAKLTTAKQAVAVASEVLEAFGGAGYVEDTGLPGLLRDAQVLPIWEGTTNVLSLDVVRVLSKGTDLAAIEEEVRRRVSRAADGDCARAGEAALRAVEHARAWLREATSRGQPVVEAGARRLALTLGRSMELALLVEHAAWAAGAASARGDGAPAAAARHFARQGVDVLPDDDSGQDASVLGS